MSFRKLIQLNSFQPLISRSVDSFNKQKIKFISTYKEFKNKSKEYDDPTKYDHVKTSKFIPFYGWIETHEYIKK